MTYQGEKRNKTRKRKEEREREKNKKRKTRHELWGSAWWRGDIGYLAANAKLAEVGVDADENWDSEM